MSEDRPLLVDLLDRDDNGAGDDLTAARPVSGWPAVRPGSEWSPSQGPSRSAGADSPRPYSPINAWAFGLVRRGRPGRRGGDTRRRGPSNRTRAVAMIGALGIIAGGGGWSAVTANGSRDVQPDVPASAMTPTSAAEWAQNARISLQSVERQLDLLSQVKAEWFRSATARGGGPVPPVVTMMLNHESVLMQHRATLQSALAAYDLMGPAAAQLAAAESELAAVQRVLSTMPTGPASSSQSARAAQVREQSEIWRRQRDAKSAELANLNNAVHQAIAAGLPDAASEATTRRLGDSVLGVTQAPVEPPPAPGHDQHWPGAIIAQRDPESRERLDVNTGAPPRRSEPTLALAGPGVAVAGGDPASIGSADGPLSASGPAGGTSGDSATTPGAGSVGAGNIGPGPLRPVGQAPAPAPAPQPPAQQPPAQQPPAPQPPAQQPPAQQAPASPPQATADPPAPQPARSAQSVKQQRRDHNEADLQARRKARDAADGPRTQDEQKAVDTHRAKVDQRQKEYQDTADLQERRAKADTAAGQRSKSEQARVEAYRAKVDEKRADQSLAERRAIRDEADGPRTPAEQRRVDTYRAKVDTARKK